MWICGEIQVTVRYQEQGPHELPLVVIKGRGPTLLGRNWLYRRLGRYQGCTPCQAISPNYSCQRLPNHGFTILVLYHSHYVLA
jgi:hypothetical protein